MSPITTNHLPQFPCWLYCPNHPEIGGWTWWSTATPRTEFTHWTRGKPNECPTHNPDGTPVADYAR